MPSTKREATIPNYNDGTQRAQDTRLDTQPARELIPIAAPVFAGNEREYVLDCMDSGWISSGGKYVGLFENKFAEFCHVRHAVACCNGTIALHLALLALGVTHEDEVIVPTLTFVATANAVTYCGARPVFADVEQKTWNLDATQLESLITKRTKGIIAVHLYGLPADMDAIRAIAARHNLFVVEDAAEAHGALYKGQPVGSLSDIATFSFYGNKILSTGEGGMVTTDNEELAKRARLLHAQGMDATRRYWFPVIGYNYRMMNLPAAIGLAQLERADWHIARRHEVAAWYMEELADIRGISWQLPRDWARHAQWLVAILLDDKLPISRDDLIDELYARGIETRPLFYPLHTLPPYQASASSPINLPVAERLATRGLCLPTWAGLTQSDVQRVCRNLRECIENFTRR